jgi:hypothetical protein
VSSIPILDGVNPAERPPDQHVQLGVAVQQQPTGKHLVVTNIQSTMFSFSYALPPDAAQEIGAKLGELYSGAADHARRADLGLIIPPTTGGKPA